jgi:transcriptional accessory protein Tex/SPT6
MLDKTTIPAVAVKITKAAPDAATEAQAKASTKKVPPKKTTTEDVTLADICKELKVDPREARVRLRAAVADKKIKHAAGKPWSWPKDSPVIKQVKTLLKQE